MATCWMPEGQFRHWYLASSCEWSLSFLSGISQCVHPGKSHQIGELTNSSLIFEKESSSIAALSANFVCRPLPISDFVSAKLIDELPSHWWTEILNSLLKMWRTAPSTVDIHKDWTKLSHIAHSIQRIHRSGKYAGSEQQPPVSELAKKAHDHLPLELLA